MKKNEHILLDHGSGGRLSNQLVADYILPKFNNAALSELHDGARVDWDGSRLAFSTDSYVVDPIFFPGGNIGDLAINGTVNDIAMCGGEPLYLSVGLILEEGLALVDLERILESMRLAAQKACVQIITGDTKVVPKGAADKIFINTSGVGRIESGIDVASHKASPGDKIIMSGGIADHGVTVLTQRENMNFDISVKSDSAPLNHMVQSLLKLEEHLHVLRDPTRGGVGTALNEIALSSNVGITITECQIPMKDEVAGICEFLGFDPLYLANEGKLLAIVSGEHAEEALGIIKACEYGRQAAIIGTVTNEHPAKVFMKTGVGGTRIVGMLTGEQLPRIC